MPSLLAIVEAESRLQAATGAAGAYAEEPAGAHSAIAAAQMPAADMRNIQRDTLAKRRGGVKHGYSDARD